MTESLAPWQTEAAAASAHGAPAVVIDRVTRTFGTTRALDDLSIEIAAGETFGLLGHNGAGKTTTVRLLNGLLPPTAGRSRVLGLDPAHDGAAIRARTGVLTETPSLDDRLTGREALTFVAELHSLPRSEVAGAVDGVLETFGLAERGGDRIGTYSRGMRQRLALARTLIHRPTLLFLDEPTTALDPVAAQQVHELIAGYRADAERTVVICTHNLAEAQKLCDRVAILEHGRLMALGSPAEIARLAGARVNLYVEVRPEHEAAALAALTDPADGREVRREREGRLVVAEAARDQVPAIVYALARARVDVFRIEPDEPTLEDAYLALHAPGRSRPT